MFFFFFFKLWSKANKLKPIPVKIELKMSLFISLLSLFASTCCCLTRNSSVSRWSNEPWTRKNKHVGPILRLLPFLLNKPKNESFLLCVVPDYGPLHPWPAGFQSVQDPQSPAGPLLTLVSHVCRSQLQRTGDKNRIPVFLKPLRSKQWDGILLVEGIKSGNSDAIWRQKTTFSIGFKAQMLIRSFYHSFCFRSANM